MPILARKSLLIVLNNMLGGLLGFVTLSVIAHHLGADGLGIIGFGLSFLGMFTFISNMGFDSAHNKRMSEGGDPARCLGTYIYLKLILTVLMALVSVVAIYIYSRFFSGFSSVEEERVVIAFLGYYIVWSLSLIPITTFNSERKQAKAQLPGVAELIVRAPLIIVLVVSGFGILYVALSYLAGILVLFFIAIYFMKGYTIKRPDRQMIRSYALFAFPISLISIIAVLYLYLDKVMIGVFWNNTEVGYYYGAQRIIMFLITSSSAVAILLFPTISSLHSKGEIHKINILIRGAERYLSMIVFPVAALTIAMNHSIVHLILGDGFGDADMILSFLSLYALVAILNKPYSQVLTGTGRTGIAVRISAVIFLANFLLNLLLIPKSMMGIPLAGLGGVGAAAATFLSDTGRFILLRREAGRIIGRTFQATVMIKHITASSLSSGMLYLLFTMAVPWELRIILLIPGLIGGLIFYLFLLMIFREFTKSDLEFFMDMLHPGKMGHYIRSELKDKE